MKLTTSINTRKSRRSKWYISGAKPSSSWAEFRLDGLRTFHTTTKKSLQTGCLGSKTNIHPTTWKYTRSYPLMPIPASVHRLASREGWRSTPTIRITSLLLMRLILLHHDDQNWRRAWIASRDAYQTGGKSTGTSPMRRFLLKTRYQ